MMEVQIGC